MPRPFDYIRKEGRKTEVGESKQKKGNCARQLPNTHRNKKMERIELKHLYINYRFFPENKSSSSLNGMCNI